MTAMALRLAKEQYVKSFTRPLAVCTVLALSIGSVVVTASAASAAEPASDIATIDSLLAAGSDITLTADITAAGTSLDLASGGSSTIDLNGHELTVQASGETPGILVPGGAHLTIKDSAGDGVLTSTGGEQSAGIGSAKGVDVDPTNAGLVEIQSGTVIANAGIWGTPAGIGGSGWSGGPDVLISGGDVTATGGGSGAGIGSGYNRDSGTILISGGTVTANAGDGATAIGGPRQGSNSSTTISGGYVTLNGKGASVLGYGLDSGVSASSFGKVAITGGRVYIPQGSYFEIPVGATVPNSGEIINYGSIIGSGTISNSGAIVGSGDVTTRVAGFDYFVGFDALTGQVDAANVPVRASSFSNAGRSLPEPSHQALPFTGWNTEANGTGSAVEPETDLSESFGLATSERVPVTLYAMYGPKPTLVTETIAGATRGQLYSQTVTATGEGDIDYSVVGALPAGLEFDAVTRVISGTPTQAGLFPFSVVAHNEGGADVRTFSLDVQREATDLLVVTPVTPTAIGSKASVHFAGLDSNEEYTISWNGKALATGVADAHGWGTRTITVPSGPVGERTITVTGSNAQRLGGSPLTVVAAKAKFSVSTNKKTYHYGQTATVTVKKLAPGEEVVISFRGKTVTHKYAHANSKGTYTVKVSVGSTKGTKTIKVTGAAKTRAGSISVKVKK